MEKGDCHFKTDTIPFIMVSLGEWFKRRELTFDCKYHL